MNQFFIGIIIVLGGASYWLWNENQTLVQNNVQLESAVAEQQRTIDTIRENFERQGQALSNLQRANAQVEAEKDRYLDIFRRHNLDKLAIVRPGLIETRVNEGTQAVFEDIENDTKIISNLDSPDSD